MDSQPPSAMSGPPRGEIVSDDRSTARNNKELMFRHFWIVNDDIATLAAADGKRTRSKMVFAESLSAVIESERFHFILRIRRIERVTDIPKSRTGY